MTVLLVEDDVGIGRFVSQGLAARGVRVRWERSAGDVEALVAAGGINLVILDLGLPDVDGLELCTSLRAAERGVPILMLTARGSLNDRLDGFAAGADDYLVKPIDLDELSARIRALTRRRAGRAEPMLSRGELLLDPAARRVTLAGTPVDLSGREFSLLRMLLENTDRVLTRQQLEQSLYTWGDEPESNALEVHIHHLRKKLGSDLIRTLRGVGYTIPK